MYKIWYHSFPSQTNFLPLYFLLYGHLCTKGHIGKLLYFCLKYNNIEENSLDLLALNGWWAHFWNNCCGQGNMTSWDHSGITSNQTTSEDGEKLLFLLFEQENQGHNYKVKDE